MIELRVDDGRVRTVRVAAALDPRDIDGIAAQVELTILTPTDWRDQVQHRPDAVLVQSLEVRPSPLPVVPLGGQARALAAWCRRAGVPSIYWSTVEGARALDDVSVARHFDHVATADLTRVDDWRDALGHDRVHVTPLGVAPPAPSTDARAQHATLATAFDPSQPHPVLLDLVDAAVETLPIVVHALGPGGHVPAVVDPFRAPAPDLAHTDATSSVGLHLPAATQSPTILDRRLLAQLAAGLPSVGAYAHATRVHFGGVVTSTNDPTRLRAAVADAVTGPTRTHVAEDVLAAHGWATALRRLLGPAMTLTGDRPETAGFNQRLRVAEETVRSRPTPGPTPVPLTPLAPLLAGISDPRVEILDDHGDVIVVSDVEGATDVWSSSTTSPSRLSIPGWTTVWCEVEPRGSLDLLLQFIGEHGAPLATTVAHGNTRSSVLVPRGTRTTRVGVRLHESGRLRLGGLRLGGEPAPVPTMTTGDHLVVTNRYPTYDAPYNNMFVHKRASAYAARAASVDVLQFAEFGPGVMHEFDGVECTTGGATVLDAMLADGEHASIAAHFMSPAVWQVLQHHLDDHRLCVWIHGFEIQPWWRRAFSYTSDEELEHAKQATGERMAMWREVLVDPRPHFVFVSRFLAAQAMEDTGVHLPEDRYSIIHNPIDTDLFAHRPKTPEQRFDLLSIRPFASNIYANDLTVAAILELRDEPWFDRLRVRMIGEGRLFDEVTAPLRGLPNVTLERRSLLQPEIAQLHREHGVFLCPSRLDSHGVSRDEAMSSGLVPITSDVAAIPEFVDDRCGFLAPPDDHHAIADAIRRLIDDPDLFVRMSAAAAARVRSQAGHRIVIDQELAVLRTSS